MSVRPERTQHVVLHLGDNDEMVPARVDETSSDSLTLVLSAPPEVPVDGHAVVEYTTPRGVHRVSGDIEGEPSQTDSGILRLRRDGADFVLQRRNHVRVDAVVPAQVTINDPERGVARTTTLNVSGGGLLLTDPLKMRPNTIVDIELTLSPADPPVKARGKVVREADDDRKGVEILEISDADRQRLVRFVTEQERLALRLRGTQS